MIIDLFLCFFFFSTLKSLLNLLQCHICFLLWFFGHKPCGILVPQTGIEPVPPALEGEVLTTGPPRKSPEIFFMWLQLIKNLQFSVHLSFWLKPFGNFSRTYDHELETFSHGRCAQWALALRSSLQLILPSCGTLPSTICFLPAPGVCHALSYHRPLYMPLSDCEGLILLHLILISNIRSSRDASLTFALDQSSAILLSTAIISFLQDHISQV